MSSDFGTERSDVGAGAFGADRADAEFRELEEIEVESLEDVERLLTLIGRIRGRSADDAVVKEWADHASGNVCALVEDLSGQLKNQLTEVLATIRRLPYYLIHWGAVREFMRDILAENQKQRGVVNLGLQLATRDEHKRHLTALADHLDKQADECRSVEAYRVNKLRTFRRRCLGLLVLLGLVAGALWWLFV